MEKSVEMRSAYWFDPTASEAIAGVSRGLQNHHNGNGHLDKKPDPYHASSEDIERFRGIIFEPERLVTNRQIKRMRWQLMHQELEKEKRRVLKGGAI